MKKLLAFCGILFFSGIVYAAEIDYPPLSGQVVDEVGVLTEETKAKLSKILAADKDNQVVVAVLKNLRGQDGREYGINLARHWQLGQKGKDNGVLILISPEDRYAGIEVGYGLEGILPDSLVGRILREFIISPIKKNNDYNQAVLNGATAVMSIISNPEGAVETEFSGDLFLGLFMFILIVILLGKGHSGGNGRSHSGGRFRWGFGGGFRGGGGGFGGGGAGGRF